MQTSEKTEYLSIQSFNHYLMYNLTPFFEIINYNIYIFTYVDLTNAQYKFYFKFNIKHDYFYFQL